MSERHALGGRVLGNREVSHPSIRGVRGHPRAANAEAYSKEGGSRGKHGFTRGSEAEPSDERGVFA